MKWDFLKGVKDKFLDALFIEHEKCIDCGRDLSKKNVYDLCDECLELVPFNNARTCKRCGKNVVGQADYCFHCKTAPREFDGGRAPFLYEGAIKKAIMNFKYNNAQYLSRTFGKILAREFVLSPFEIDIVIPVPLFENRKRKRGYNQSELLGFEFCKELGFDLNIDAFIRIKDTEKQTGKGKREREENVSKAFKVQNKKAIKGKNILLIDDVITTCATMDECARTLKASGANKVYALAIAHTKTVIPSERSTAIVKNAKLLSKTTKMMYNKSK